MKLLMHVLKRSNKLGINNETLTSKEIVDKLEEEFEEVVEAINIYDNDKTLKNLKEIIKETFDLIQICILILWRTNRAAKNFNSPGLIEKINIEHKDKLIGDRGWIIHTGIEIDVKE